MNIFVMNSGSSTIKAALISPDTGTRHLDIRVDGIGNDHCFLEINGTREALTCKDHAEALAALNEVAGKALAGLPIDAVGHRVAHGGRTFTEPTLITDDVLETIRGLSSLAPLHIPACLAAIKGARSLYPNIPHVAIFDTAFHATLPMRARRYALPTALVDKLDIRRYGFHGTSHQFVAQAAADHLKADIRNLRLITCHLGSGCSITAIEYGRSIETSMGMTPLEGLVMGSRPGDLDPGVIIQILRDLDGDVDALDRLLNKDSGLVGLTGTGDMREIEDRAATGDRDCQLAIHLFSHSVRKYIGAYAAVMGGLDAIVFTAGIGEHSALIRHRIGQRFDYLGAILDEDRNREAVVSRNQPVIDISSDESRARIMVIATDEELAIARQTEQLIEEQNVVKIRQKIPVAVSARHVHLRQETIEQLFGKSYHLTVRRPLSQPGQFSAEETVTLVGPKRTLEKVRILGPVRSKDQVEISRSDEFYLGVDAPVRASGDLENTPGITLVGPAGEVTLTSGLICALRHIHMSPDDAVLFGVQDHDIVDVAIGGHGRSLTFDDVLVRVNPDFRLEMHVDTDEANAGRMCSGDVGVLVPAVGEALLTRRKITGLRSSSSIVKSR